MSSRLINVYDGPLPSCDEVMFGGAANDISFPSECWTSEMADGEIALFCKNFKSGTPLQEDGTHRGESRQTCRVFPNLTEAEAYAREIVKAHPGVTCALMGKNGVELKHIQNQPALRKWTLGVLFVVLLQVATLAVLGGGVVWLVRVLIFRMDPLARLSVWQWEALLVVGLPVSVAFIIGAMLVRAKRSVARLQRIHNKMTPEEKERYSQLNELAVSTDPAERAKARKLLKEYSDMIRQNLSRQ